ncbi:MAG TPA: DUF4430 domain-containing protein [Thermoleophilaceae bacterium]|nr:DUF4430 domain-containing protein [Thermoleophilaceae bacterium]
MTLRRALLALLAAAALAATPGCGLGAGAERSGAGADLRVTRDFGHQLVLAKDGLKIREDETAMRLLKRHADVETRFGGGFVQSIDGLAGRGADGTDDWFYYVNGIEADEGAADYELSPGDVVQWDRHDWSETAVVPAIVGAFPQPFLDGLGGKRFPVRVECQDAESAPCRQVKQALRDAGVPANGAALGAPGNQNVARVVVADWATARQQPTARLVELGPRRSGVFARFTDGGDTLELLGRDGEPARDAGAGSGLVAALRPNDRELLWLVTGVDDAGVEAAAAALRPRDLRDAFAIAVVGGRVAKLPLTRER